MGKGDKKVVPDIVMQFNIAKVAQINNRVKSVTTYIGADDEIVSTQQKAEKPDKHSHTDQGDNTYIHAEILEYVKRVRHLLNDDAKSTFVRIWEDILNLPEVESKIYNHGKQKGTNFNRDLVANILYHLRKRKIYKVVYRDNYNGAALTEALEGDKEHSVKHALRDEPPKDVRDAIDKMLNKKY